MTDIPPQIFLPRWDMEFTSREVIFRGKSSGPVIPYTHNQQTLKNNPNSPHILLKISDVSFPSVIDSGAYHSWVGKDVVEALKIERFPNAGMLWDEGNFYNQYWIPVQIPGLGIFTVLMHPGKGPVSLISGIQILKAGFSITFSDRGIRWGHVAIHR